MRPEYLIRKSKKKLSYRHLSILKTKETVVNIKGSPVKTF